MKKSKKTLYRINRFKYSIEDMKIESFVGTIDDIVNYFYEQIRNGIENSENGKRVTTQPKDINELITTLKNSDFNNGVSGVKYEWSIF